MSDAVVDDKRSYRLMNAVTTNMERLRHSIDALRQLHDRWQDSTGW